IVGIGILWKYGYYSQVRKEDQTLNVLFEEKRYGFLKSTDIKFTIKVAKHEVWVTAYYLDPEIFHTAPIFLLSTDLPENDYLAKTISHKLYDANPDTQIAASILLGEGGAKLLELIGWTPEIYHLNESHALPLIFFLYCKYKNTNEVKKRFVFTNHTPEDAGNKKTNIAFLEKMSFFCEVPVTEIKAVVQSTTDELNHTQTALKLAKISNGVSVLHKEILHRNWKDLVDLEKIISITNAQNYTFWHDEELTSSLNLNKEDEFRIIKKKKKKELFDVVADQCGEIYNPDICTIVFAKRFAAYKRADIFFHDMDRFHELVSNKDRPVQIIWAGKPYPMDYTGISVFDKIVDICKKYTNCSILVGYEINLSKILKRGADIWLNVPRYSHEASGTSGMSAAMNGCVNVAIADGWFPEFAKDKINSFIVPHSDISKPEHIQDDEDASNLFNLLKNEVLPMYYDYPSRWFEIVKKSSEDIIPYFDSNRMAKEYYDKLYNA
ncbi:MAG: alpha-glucan family phosphorylase, partial [Ferruginibacter sp.]|nr:alpha-glucan family phosphorylase [Ferruginibacter sp.]